MADIQVGASAPQLLTELRAERSGAPTITLTVRNLSLEPELLRGRAAWGVWVEADLRLSDEPLRTPARQHDAYGRVEYDHEMSLPVARGSTAQQRLLDALCEPPGGEMQIGRASCRERV